MQASSDSSPPSGPRLRAAFEALVQILNERKVRYAIIGGLATLQHTRVRTTDDIDALLTVPQLALPGLFERLEEMGFSVEVMKCIREFRDEGLTTITYHGVMIDLLRPVIPLFNHVLDRAVPSELLGHQVRISSAESLILMKFLSMRPQDQSDIQDIINAYGGELDVDYISSELQSIADRDDPRFKLLADWVSAAKARNG